MAILSAPAPHPPSRTQLSIQRPPTTALDSSDEARTDTSTSPSMNPVRSPGTDAKARSINAPPPATTAATSSSSSSSNGRRRKAESAPATGEDKPAPKQRKYERKTKRFIWPDDLHRLFVAAIFDVGLKNASPKALLALMEAAGPNSGLTTEHLKSHLQKYRLNYERSRMEFLEYYDRSAKRNLKRRRRQAQHRASGAGSEANTMFVFPISNSKHRKGRGSDSDSDSDDSDLDTGDSNNNDSRMEEDAKGQATPQGRRGSPAAATDAHVRNLNYSQLMQSAQQQPMFDGGGHTRQQHPQPTNDRMMNVVPAPASTGMIPIAPQHLPPVYAAHAQRKQASDHDRDLAAAAAAVAAYRYPLGQLPASGGVAGMPELTDPQWSILNSLMSPQLAGMTGPVGEGGLFPQGATSEAVGRGSADGFMLHEEPIDLQMQMHLAMQAQMNLHRQMLTRKVEVAQHLARHSSMGSIDTSTVPNNGSRGNPPAPQRGYSESWGSAQQLQQQQYQQQQQQENYQQQQMNLLSRHSLSVPASATQAPIAASSVPADTIMATPTASEAATVSTPIANKGSGVGDSAAASTGPTAEIKSDDDGMDLYRWDRIDLNVELDDDDLFGFLKS